MKVKCTVCKEYVLREMAIRSGPVSFCSEACVTAAWTNRKVYNGPSASTSETSTPRRIRSRSGVSGEVRRATFEADGNKCRFCGSSQSAIECHHVLYRSEGGPHTRDNLLSLCSRCHARVHSDKKRYQQLALGVIWLREVEQNRWTTIRMLERQFAKQQQKEKA